MEGFHVFSANTGKKGIELAIEFIPDLIICDHPMPGIDGHEVLRLLLDNTHTSEIPFIFCSTLSETCNKSEALKLGADDYIIKPFELDNLLHKAKNYMINGSKRQIYS